MPTTTQAVTCTPVAICSGAPSCADIEGREAAAHTDLAAGTEHYYIHGAVPGGEAFSAAAGDCTGSTVEDLPEATQVQSYDVQGCHCQVTIECDRVRTTTLACE